MIWLMPTNFQMIWPRKFNTFLLSKLDFINFLFRNNNLISLSKEHQLDELLEILPSHLKAEINKFLYQAAISKIQLLANREMRFYCDFLSKFLPMSIKGMTVFAK